MLEMRAIVLAVKGEEASVQPVGNSGCGHCSTEGGCGSSNLSKLFCSSKPRQFTVLNRLNAKVGDEVQVSLPDGLLLRGAMKMYVVPLLLLLAGGMAGAALAETAQMRDGAAALGALVGLLLGFAFARFTTYRAGRAVVSSIIASHPV
jgi:sigma-E factor negative regulatory protein RseC